MRYVSSAMTETGGNPCKNCILSPIYTPESILSKFPTTKIFVAEVDPFRDQGVYMGLTLKKAGVSAEVFYLKEYIHNFLQFQSPAFKISEY